MKSADKIKVIEEFISNPNISRLYETLEEIDLIKYNYSEYMTTAPINCDDELRRVHNAEFDEACAIMTMLLREDHFSNGALRERHDRGQVIPVLERLVKLLESEM